MYFFCFVFIVTIVFYLHPLKTVYIMAWGLQEKGGKIVKRYNILLSKFNIFITDTISVTWRSVFFLYNIMCVFSCQNQPWHGQTFIRGMSSLLIHLFLPSSFSLLLLLDFIFYLYLLHSNQEWYHVRRWTQRQVVKQAKYIISI